VWPSPSAPQHGRKGSPFLQTKGRLAAALGTLSKVETGYCGVQSAAGGWAGVNAVFSDGELLKSNRSCNVLAF